MADLRAIMMGGYQPLPGMNIAGTPMTPELLPRDPSFSERATDWIARQLGGGSRAQQTAGNITGLLDWLPGYGDAVTADEAGTAFRQGDYGTGSLLLGAGMVGMVPGAGDIASGALKRAARAPLDAADSLFGKTASPYDLPPGTDPRYLGAAPDRSDFTYLRYQPRKNTSRVEASLTAMRDPANPVRQQMMNDIQRGIELGGADWYNTEELRDWFVAELGDQEGHRQWSEFMDLMGATSPGSKVPSNIGNASEMRRRLYSENVPRGSNMAEGEAYRDSLLGVSALDEARDIARGRTKGYGHKTQGLQELIAARQQQGQWGGLLEPDVPPARGNWTDNPKPKGFSQSLKGSGRNIAADLHFTRYMAMASRDPQWLSTQAEIGAEVTKRLQDAGGKSLKPYFGKRVVDGKTLNYFNAKKAVKDGKISVDEIADMNVPQMWAQKPNDSEYAALEALMYEIGQETGMTGPQVQAALWMGAADRTGVDPTSQGTFMELLRRRADERASKEGMTREQVMRRFIRDKGLLSVAPLAGTAAGLGVLNARQGDDRPSM